MKFVCLSDMHLSSENPESRLDNLVEIQFEKLEWVLQLAKKENAVILQAGDFFHKPRSWHLLPLVIDLLKKYQIPIYSVRGQHDVYMYSEETKDKTNLGILVKVGLIIPLSTDTLIKAQDVSIYGANFGQNLAKIKRTGYTIGVIHTSISDAPLWKGHEFTPADKYLNDNSEYDFILVGDIHRRFEVKKDKRMLVNVGPMLRREATEYNFVHSPALYILDTDKPKESNWVDIPHEPAKKVLSRDHLLKQEEADSILDEFVDSIKSSSETVVGVSFMENLLAFAKENKIDQGVMNMIARFVDHNKREGL